MSKEKFFRTGRLLILFHKWEKEKASLEKRKEDIAKWFSGPEKDIWPDIDLIVRRDLLCQISNDNNLGSFMITLQGQKSLRENYLPIKDKLLAIYKQQKDE